MYCILIKVSNTCEERFQENRSEHIIYFVRVLMMPQLKISIIQPTIGAFSRKTFRIINLHLKRHCKQKTPDHLRWIVNCYSDLIPAEGQTRFCGCFLRYLAACAALGCIFFFCYHSQCYTVIDIKVKIGHKSQVPKIHLIYNNSVIAMQNIYAELLASV